MQNAIIVNGMSHKASVKQISILTQANNSLQLADEKAKEVINAYNDRNGTDYFYTGCIRLPELVADPNYINIIPVYKYYAFDTFNHIDGQIARIGLVTEDAPAPGQEDDGGIDYYYECHYYQTLEECVAYFTKAFGKNYNEAIKHGIIKIDNSLTEKERQSLAHMLMGL